VSFLTKTNDFLTRLKITWFDRHVPTIILIYMGTNFEPWGMKEAPKGPKYWDHIVCHIVCWGRFWPKLLFFFNRWKITWVDRHIPTIIFFIWKHLLNHICVTEALNRPQKPPNMVLYHSKFSQPYSILSERRLRCGAVYHPLYLSSFYFVEIN